MELVEHFSGNLSEKDASTEKKNSKYRESIVVLEIVNACNVKKNSSLFTVNKLGKLLRKL